MAQSSNILEERWQRIVYEKHRKRICGSKKMTMYHRAKQTTTSFETNKPGSVHEIPNYAAIDRGTYDLRETKSKLKGETTLEYDDEEAQLQLRFRRIMAEEKRQAIIDKQNSKLLQRIVDIMTSKKKTFPVSSDTELNRKVSKTSVTDNSKPKARHSSVKLPKITSAVKERRASK